MPSRIAFRRIFTVTTLGLLSACGGGGGDSDDGGSQQTPLSLDPNNYGSNPAPIRQVSDLDRSVGVYDDLTEIQTLVDDVDYALSSTAVGYSATASDYCSQEAGNMEIKEEETGPYSGRISYRFDDCQVAGYRETLWLDGTLVIEGSGDEVQGTIKETYAITGRIGADGAPLGINGTLTSRITERSYDDQSIEITSPAMEYLLRSKYVAIRDSRMSVAIKNDSFSLSMQSDLIGSAIGGFVTVTTPVTISGPLNGCPTQGHMKMTGDGVVEARYGQTTGTAAAVEILLNGSQVENLDGCYGSLPAVVGGGNSSAPLPSDNYSSTPEDTMPDSDPS